MERNLVETDPKSAPQVVSIPEGAGSGLYGFAPDPRDKYFNPEDQHNAPASGTQYYIPTAPAFAGNPAAVSKNKKWMWIIAAAIVSVIIVVAAVVGGVVGSQKAHENDTQRLLSASITSTLSHSANDSTTTSATSSTTSTFTPTSSTAQPTETSFGATIHMFANDTCGAKVDSFTFLNNSPYKCVVVPSNKRSIRVTDNR
ncbi:hypothetical protein BBP40_011069 [Aspergillus hancockii]|nr:hypothetical protein BBP40_011069 [Aspergillus hancockii]